VSRIPFVFRYLAAYLAIVALAAYLLAPAKKPESRKTYIRCADGGLTSSRGPGTCSSHGGIAR